MSPALPEGSPRREPAGGSGRWLFVGDAPNDASMFAAFPRSVGVANLAPHADRLPVASALPHAASHGEGFVELAEHLLRERARCARPRQLPDRYD